MDRRRDRTRWVEVLNCCTAWIPLRKDPHGPEAYGTSGSITLPQPKAARDHCTPAHRTSYQVGRVRLSPPASPQPTAMPKLRPRSQASREKPGLKAISQDFKQEALTLDKERKLRLLSHPRSGTARKDPKANAAMMALRSHHYENIDILQPPSEEFPPQPGIAGPRVSRPNAAVSASPAVKSAQSRMLRAKRGAYGQQKPDRRMAPPCRGCKPRSPVPFTLHPSLFALCASPDGSHPARPKQKRKLLLAVMPHDRQPSFNEQFEI